MSPNKISTVLAIETSCDDTSVAIVTADGFVIDCQSGNQDILHAPFGGIVPEIASRSHTEVLLPLIEKVMLDNSFEWKSIDGIVVTNRPGLVGSLIVGLVTAKSLSQTMGKPFLGVNHLEGHIVAPYLSDQRYQSGSSWGERNLTLAVSGGHTSIYLVEGLGSYQVLGATRDDASGEAFDKFAKVLGLGWPGGSKIDTLAIHGNTSAFEFPRGLIDKTSLDFSFSGLKASGFRMVESLSEEDRKNRLSDLAASFQEAIVDTLVEKLDRAFQKFPTKVVALTGGVSANSRLRKKTLAWAEKNKIKLLVPPLRYCTDNAAMIGYAGILRMNQGERHDLSLGPSPIAWPNDFKKLQDLT